MKIRYIDDLPETTVFDITFKNGVWVEVYDILACTKLSGNPCFEVMEGDEIEEAEFTVMEKPKRRGRPKKEVSNGYSIGSEEEGSSQAGAKPE